MKAGAKGRQARKGRQKEGLPLPLSFSLSLSLDRHLPLSLSLSHSSPRHSPSPPPLTLTQRIGDQIERGGVVLHLGVEAGEVEAIEDVVLVDLAEVLVALCAEKPGDPAVGGVVGRVGGELLHCCARQEVSAGAWRREREKGTTHWWDTAERRSQAG